MLYPGLENKSLLVSPDADPWSSAMGEEFTSMKRTELLSYTVSLPVDGIVIGTKWVFKRK